MKRSSCVCLKIRYNWLYRCLCSFFAWRWLSISQRCIFCSWSYALRSLSRLRKGFREHLHMPSSTQIRGYIGLIYYRHRFTTSHILLSCIFRGFNFRLPTFWRLQCLIRSVKLIYKVIFRGSSFTVFTIASFLSCISLLAIIPCCVFNFLVATV